jgi:hypothetical protein
MKGTTMPSEQADFFDCGPATLIDRTRWESHRHKFDPKDDEDKERAMKEAIECKRLQCEKLGMEFMP